MKTKVYLAQSGGFQGKDVIVRFEAKSDDEAFLKATVEEGMGLEELLLLVESGVSGKEIVERDSGSYFDAEHFGANQEENDYSDVYVEELTLLFNVTDNEVVFGHVEDMNFGF